MEIQELNIAFAPYDASETIMAATEPLCGMLQEKLLEKGAAMTDVPDKAAFYEEKVLPAMSALREPADQLETLLGKDFWPMPTYTDLMYGIL